MEVKKHLIQWNKNLECEQLPKGTNLFVRCSHFSFCLLFFRLFYDKISENRIKKRRKKKINKKIYHKL